MKNLFIDRFLQQLLKQYLCGKTRLPTISTLTTGLPFVPTALATEAVKDQICAQMRSEIGAQFEPSNEKAEFDSRDVELPKFMRQRKGDRQYF